MPAGFIEAGPTLAHGWCDDVVREKVSVYVMAVLTLGMHTDCIHHSALGVNRKVTVISCHSHS
jgi:hypothetical protein